MTRHNASMWRCFCILRDIARACDTWCMANPAQSLGGLDAHHAPGLVDLVAHSSISRAASLSPLECLPSQLQKLLVCPSSQRRCELRILGRRRDTLESTAAPVCSEVRVRTNDPFHREGWTTARPRLSAHLFWSARNDHGFSQSDGSTEPGYRAHIPDCLVI